MLVILVGQTVQTMQKVGWLPVSPIEGLELPYRAGAWLGLYPTWQGLGAQFAAMAFVLGSYFGAEALRKRRRARILGEPLRAGAAATGPADLDEAGSLVVDLQRRVPDAERRGELVLHRPSQRVAVLVTSDEHVGGERVEP